MTDQQPAPITPRAELDAFREQRLSGAITQEQYFEHMERLGPLIQPSAGDAPALTQEQARQRLDELQHRRAEGKLLDREYQAEFEKLGPQASAGAGDVTYENPDGTKVTMRAHDAAALEKVYAPPTSPEGYDLALAHNAPEEVLAFHKSACESLHSLGFPNEIVRFGDQATLELAKKLSKADPVEIDIHNAGVAEALRQAWGDQFDTKRDRFIDLVARLPGPLGDLLEERPWLLANPLLIMKIESFAEHRARKRS